MAEEYDIFISYRRFEDEARQKENISQSGRLSELCARKASRFFVLFLTDACLDRCKNDDDWVRQEIEVAKESGATIVPVTLDNAVEQWPNDLPESLRFLTDDGGIEITNIHNDSSYQSDIDGIIEAIIGPPVEKKRGTEVHIDTDYDCQVFRYKKYVMLAKHDDDNVLFLQKGEHRFMFRADGCPEVENKQVLMTEDDNIKCIDVLLREDVEKKIIQKKREQQKKERKEREEKERKERERQEKEQKEREERERKEREARGEFEVNGVKFKMIYVEGGTFMMGATEEQGSDADDNERPTHDVTLRDYYIGETVVTQELWKAVMGGNPSRFKGDHLPVEYVSWNDAQEFIAKLNKETGREFRLPTEAQWEYAARGGKKSKKAYRYSGSDISDEVAWYDDNSNGKTHPVKGKNANELGLYDMSGNVWEWCNDWFGGYSSVAQTDPQGPEEGSCRVLRGGSWLNYARYCRVSYRYYLTPMSRSLSVGFRLVMCP